MRKIILTCVFLVQSLLLSGCMNTVAVWEEPSYISAVSIYEDTIHTIAYKDPEHLYPILLSDRYRYEISISSQINVSECGWNGDIIPECQRFIPLLVSGENPNTLSSDPDYEYDIGVNVYKKHVEKSDDLRFDANESNASTVYDVEIPFKPFVVSIKTEEKKEKNIILLIMKKIILTPFALVADVFIYIIGIPLILILGAPMGGR